VSLGFVMRESLGSRLAYVTCSLDDAPVAVC
jgi:hypothetical protein